MRAAERMGRSSDAGVLPVDKPVGPTSHDVVARARRALGTRRIGHTGTLDPFASGLLLLCVGWATRLSEYLSAQSKAYEARLQLGTATDTDDRTGAVIATSDNWKMLDEAAIERVLASMVGPALQRPPVYSAKKVAGSAMYRLARAGAAPEPAAVTVEFHSLRLRNFAPPFLEIEVLCSAGTYVRAFARDLGESLGTKAHLTELRRTSIGRHHVRDALGIEELEDPQRVTAGYLTPLAALEHLPRVDVDDEDAAALRHGRPIRPSRVLPPATPVAVASRGDLLAIAEADGDWLKPRKVFDA